jgi:hypothetical protein
MVASCRSAMESGTFQIKIKGSHSFESMNALGRKPPPNRHLKGRLDCRFDRLRICGCHPPHSQFHPEPRFSVCTEHLI